MSRVAIRISVISLLLGTMVALVILCIQLGKNYNSKNCLSTFDHAAYEKDQVRIAQLAMLDSFWIVPEIYLIKDEALKEKVLYGKELITHTSWYLGPKGTVDQLSNGMNCQNCHLDGGTKIWGNNYAGVASTYPKVRARSGKLESIEKRVNDCIERSLNGRALSDDSKEMKAIVAYIKYLGSTVPKDSIPEGTGIAKIPFLKRAADPMKGASIYSAKCASCHGSNGEGQQSGNQKEYVYPPLWGEHSYNTGAGLYRLSRLAGYVRFNMPNGASFLNPQMNVEDSWDVAAYINSQPRPGKDITNDWPDISKKPIDHPFGPFADDFSEIQHKYGPFGPIEEFYKSQKSR
jgi:thiosulfate dehydrogenase